MIDPILARRSIREYTDEPVTNDEIRTLLEAAMAAPSGMNRKPWHFVVVTERGTLDKLADIGSHWQMLKGAPLGIVACSDPGISEMYWEQDCVAAIENLLIAVSMMGLGAVWLGCHPNQEREDAVRELLRIPGGIIPVAVLSVGRPGEVKEPRTQYDEERVHRERW